MVATWPPNRPRSVANPLTAESTSMARPKKTDAPDTTQAIDLTAGTIERLTCRTDTKAQAFLRDTKAPGLRVRVTNTGA